MDCVFIEGLELHGKHGLFDFERVEGNEFLLDIRLYGSIAEAAASDDIHNAWDYNLVAAAARKVMDGPSVNLLETLAQQIADQILADFPTAERVEVRLSKKNAPMETKAAAAGVEISRARD